jgi:hypothetical protein
MKKARTALTDEQKAELDAPAKLPDDQIHTSDIPETTDWSGGRRGVFYRQGKSVGKCD